MNQPPGGTRPITEVAIGLVQRRGCYLVGEREPGTPLAGHAEFPGGKCRPGETPEQCVVRECREETGLEVTVTRRRRQIVHEYPHTTVRLTFFDCTVRDDTEPRGPFRWVLREELERLRFPEANREVVEEMLRMSSSPQRD